MEVDVVDLKKAIASLNVAIEKTKINPMSGWLEMETSENLLLMKVSNYGYYFETSVEPRMDLNYIHVTIAAESFISLVSKLDNEIINLSEGDTSLILTTKASKYVFPLIKEGGKTKPVSTIQISDLSASQHVVLNGYDLGTVANANVKGLVESLFSKEIQQYIYMDEVGAITYTENVYINDFKHPAADRFKILLNATQAKLLCVFGKYNDVDLYIDSKSDYESANKIMFKAGNTKLVLIVQPQSLTDTFPSIRLRKLLSTVRSTHVILDKKSIDKALARLMVFDKKFDVTIMNYSKLVFREDHVLLESTKSNNYEIIPYISAMNAVEHESIIRFSDLVKQLKALNSKEIDISYGDIPAIVICGDIYQLIPEVQLVTKV